MVDSISAAITPLVRAGLLRLLLWLMVVNLTVDMLYGVINPKIRKR